MSVKIKEIIKDCLPPLLLRSCYRYRHNFSSRQYKSIIARNKVLRDLYKGERCFIVGNGRSLIEMDLTKLRNEYVFVVNDFFRHKDFNIIRPAFYSCIEPLTCMLSRPPGHADRPDSYYREVDLAFRGSKTKIFLKADIKDFIEKNGFLKEEEIYYLANAYSGILSVEEDVALEDRIDRLYSFADGVIFSAICCCVYMGFKEIYFIGCDCDTFSNKKRLRFYTEDKPTYEGDSNENLLYYNWWLLKRWRIVVRHFKSKGVKIFNAGVGGDNDTCERVDFNAFIFK